MIDFDTVRVIGGSIICRNNDDALEVLQYARAWREAKLETTVEHVEVKTNNNHHGIGGVGGTGFVQKVEIPEYKYSSSSPVICHSNVSMLDPSSYEAQKNLADYFNLHEKNGRGFLPKDTIADTYLKLLNEGKL